MKNKLHLILVIGFAVIATILSHGTSSLFEKNDKTTAVTTPSVVVVSCEAECKEFNLLANGTPSESFTLPVTKNGWEFEVKYSSDFVWYPKADDLDQNVKVKGNQTYDVGQNNSNDLAFCFSSLTGKPETVKVYYWPKKAV